MGSERFTPDPEQMALVPDISGNTINGHGETERRRPRYVYWGNNPGDIAHGDMQRWFYTVDPGLEDYQTIRSQRQVILEAPLADLAAERTDITSVTIADFVETGIRSGLFDKFGTTEFDPIWAFEGVEINQKNIIILHDHLPLGIPTPKEMTNINPAPI